ncbi:MAG: hypothetical protein ACC652_01500 [Acidimicrobiales bacterium]
MSDIDNQHMPQSQSSEAAGTDQIQPRRTSTLLQSVAGLVGIVLVAGVVVGGAAWIIGRDRGPGNPDAWDERVQEYVRFVESSRGLRFEQPVWVEFLEEEKFRETVTADEDDLSDEEQEGYEHYAGILRSYGLLEGDINLFEQNNELYGDEIVGYYSDETRTLTIRGEEVTTDVKLTIVHELVHALQDQNFDLGLTDELEGEALTAARALIEGDARAIEIEYLGTLSDDEQQAYFDSFDESNNESATPDQEVPSVLSASLGSSYVLGNGFIDTLRQDGGWARVNAAYSDLPTSMDQLIYPWRYLAGDAVNEVDAPDVDNTDDSEPEEIGALGWFFILARVMDPPDALLVADGWGGDLAVDFTADDGTCFVDNLTGDDTAATDSFENAVSLWVEVSPEYRSMSRDGDVLRVEGCDPGTEAKIAGEDNSEDVLQLPVVRVEVVNGWLESGAPDESAHCAGEWVATQIPLELLIADDFTDDQQAEFDGIIEGLSAECG